MGNFIELMKPLAQDSQRMNVLKETFNTDAQNMNLNWPKLSMERRRELCSNMKSIQSQIGSLTEA
jgi:ribosome recycling factor